MKYCQPNHAERKLTGFGVQALEGKDVKDLLLNVGSGGGAAPAAASAGAAAAGGAAPEAAKEEEKVEEKEVSLDTAQTLGVQSLTIPIGVRRGHGIRSLRLNVLIRLRFLVSCRVISFCTFLM